MILKVGLAVKNILPFQQLSEESSVQTRMLTLSDIEERNFIYTLLDLIVWQPEFSKGKFPKDLTRYLNQNKTTALIIYNTSRSQFDINDSAAENLISIIESPLKTYSLKLLLFNAALARKQKTLKLIDDSYLLAENETELLGDSKSIKKINEFIKLISKSSKTHCLLRGEAGTEKFKVAHFIHNRSTSVDSPIQFVNCANYSAEQLLIKLFGVEYEDDNKKEDKRGILELTHDGTLVLENIERIPEEVQLPLQIYLETQSFRKFGSPNELHINSRVIACTDYDLELFVKNDEFSRDLFYRFKAFELIIPPLRLRQDDIIPLAHYFIEQYGHKFGHKVTAITPEAERKLLEYNWPGNMDELRIVIERAVLLSRNGSITSTTFPYDLKSERKLDEEIEFLGNCSLRDLEKVHIKKVLTRTNGNKSKAAEILNISRTTLREKIRVFKLSI
jgi:two-component system response regulator AtoC